jgi:hypothetical protein
MDDSPKVGAMVGAVFFVHCYLVSTAYAGGPAVSAPNGIVDVGIGGARDGNGGPAEALGRLGGSAAVPLGNNWGLQADLSGQYDKMLAGSLQLFTRDPANYLLGLTAGAMGSNVAKLGTVGAEGELYLNRFTIGGWAGYASLGYDTQGIEDKSGGFGFVDFSYYATDNLRLGLSLATVLDHKSLGVGGEYQFAQAPVSITANVRFGEHGDTAGMAGLKFYFGGEQKSLIDRDRRDHARDRSFDLFSAAGSQLRRQPVLASAPAKASDFSDQNSCIAAGFTWDGEYCT